MKSPILELQNVITSKLETLGYSVFDGLPMTEEDYPFVAFDNDSIVDNSVKTGDISDILFPLYIWSDYLNGASKEAKQIADAIIQDFVDHEDTIVMASFTCEMCELYNLRVNRQTDSLQQLTQVILTLQFKISEN